MFSEEFENFAWEVHEDLVILEYGPMEFPKELTLITPQYTLFDQIASMEIKRILQRNKKYSK